MTQLEPDTGTKAKVLRRSKRSQQSRIYLAVVLRSTARARAATVLFSTGYAARTGGLGRFYFAGLEELVLNKIGINHATAWFRFLPGPPGSQPADTIDLGPGGRTLCGKGVFIIPLLQLCWIDTVLPLTFRLCDNFQRAPSRDYYIARPIRLYYEGFPFKARI